MMDNNPMRSACLMLINALVQSPDDLDFRMHLRNEIMRSGFLELNDVLENDPSDETRNQWKVFNEKQQEDFEDFCHKFENIESELYDPKVSQRPRSCWSPRFRVGPWDGSLSLAPSVFLITE